MIRIQFTTHCQAARRDFAPGEVADVTRALADEIVAIGAGAIIDELADAPAMPATDKPAGAAKRPARRRTSAP